MASILCFGDSITQGFVDLEGGWTQRLRRRLDQDASVPMGATTFPVHAVFNLGISGDTAEGLLARLEPELGPRRLGDQTIVVVAVGVNERAVDSRAHPTPRWATLPEGAPLPGSGVGARAPGVRVARPRGGVAHGRGQVGRSVPGQVWPSGSSSESRRSTLASRWP
jgi:GDSL-like Lipase/Acylhydrolase family